MDHKYQVDESLILPKSFVVHVGMPYEMVYFIRWTPKLYW